MIQRQKDFGWDMTLPIMQLLGGGWLDDPNTFGFTVKTSPLFTHLRMGRVVIIIFGIKKMTLL
jgi:hypothetical protein